ncbi:MAG: carboxylate-amine ligase [Candidatus Eremiobacteraeota bacterium]|nr:carboxylate-amine ligase [Candidatus Eremiobacteraeota bacterium]
MEEKHNGNDEINQPELFSIGIEEEFQVVNPDTRELCSRVDNIMGRGILAMGSSLKPEFHSSMLETVSGICGDMGEARNKISHNRKLLSDFIKESGMNLASAGTHPFSCWEDQHIYPAIHFQKIENEFREIALSALTFALHIHIGITEKETALHVINGMRPYLPVILALSANSPFHRGRDTGFMSFRSVVYPRFPRSGIPRHFTSYRQYKEYIDTLKKTGCIKSPGEVWWDARIHPFYETIEIRLCDAQTEINETLAIAALVQALSYRIYLDYMSGKKFPHIDRSLIEENRWRAGRRGLDCNIVDFQKKEEIPCREVIRGILDYVSGVVDKLKCKEDLEYVREMLNKGTGANRQLEAYKKSGDIGDVVDLLMV